MIQKRPKPSAEWWNKVEQCVELCLSVGQDWRSEVADGRAKSYVTKNGTVVAMIVPDLALPDNLFMFPRASAEAIDVALLSANLARHFGRLYLVESFEFDETGFALYGADAEAYAAINAVQLYRERYGKEPKVLKKRNIVGKDPATTAKKTTYYN
jgi:hypothetical protein